MTTGTVKFFNEGKGFGFIKEDNTEVESFAHISKLLNPEQGIKENDKVEYDIIPSDKHEGKTDAINIKLAA